jgi:hypothetical protein
LVVRGSATQVQIAHAAKPERAFAKGDLAKTPADVAKVARGQGLSAETLAMALCEKCGFSSPEGSETCEECGHSLRWWNRMREQEARHEAYRAQAEVNRQSQVAYFKKIGRRARLEEMALACVKACAKWLAIGALFSLGWRMCS